MISYFIYLKIVVAENSQAYQPHIDLNKEIESQ